MELHWRRVIFFECADYASRATEIGERLGRGGFVGDALFGRCRRNGRTHGIASRRKQSDRDLVRSAGSRARDHWHVRNGYVELSFAGEWPKESPRGAPGPVDAFLAGWIDGDSGKGRMRVQGRSDGS